MRKVTMLLVCLFAVAALAAQPPMGGGPGQGPGGMVPPAGQPPTFDELKQALNLTSDQVTSLVAIQKLKHDNAKALIDQIHAKEASLQTLLKNGSTDAAAIGTLVLAIEALRKKVTALDDSAQSDALKVLTAAQLILLNSLEAAAKLQPAIHQAIGLGLLEAPAQPQGGGPGRPGGGPNGQSGPGGSLMGGMRP